MGFMQSDKARELAAFLSREDYKAIKHMNKTELGLYLRSTWEKGFNDGMKEAERLAKTKEAERPTADSEANEC